MSSLSVFPLAFCQYLEKTFLNYVAGNLLFLLGDQYRLGTMIAEYPFPYHYLVTAKDGSTLQDLCQAIFYRLLFWRRHRRHLSRLQDMILRWYRGQRRVGRILARNARDGLPDKVFSITYHTRRDAYFNTAFSGRYPADMEGKHYVIRVHKLQTSQTAIGVFCASRYNGNRLVYEYLDQVAASGDLGRFERAYHELNVLGDLFMDPVFTEKINSFLMEYLNQTLYKLNGTNSLTRLRLFLDKSPVIARYIWKANFSTKEERGILGVALQISNRNMGGFKNAETLEALESFLTRKLSAGKDILDDLPPHIWRKIQQAKDAHEEAKKGVRVGLYGRYISSDEVEMTRVKLAEAWKDADKWIGQKNKIMK